MTRIFKEGKPRKQDRKWEDFLGKEKKSFAVKGSDNRIECLGESRKSSQAWKKKSAKRSRVLVAGHLDPLHLGQNQRFLSFSPRSQHSEV